jgi:hypothetical protein
LDQFLKLPNKNVVDINTKAGRKDMFKLTIENDNLQKKSMKIVNSLLLLCFCNSHKADFGESTGNKKKYIQ